MFHKNMKKKTKWIHFLSVDIFIFHIQKVVRCIFFEIKKPKLKDLSSSERAKAASQMPNKMVTCDGYKMTYVHRIQNAKGQWVVGSVLPLRQQMRS